MNALQRGTRGENGSLRGLTGAGQPGLHVLLGGTGEQPGAEAYTITGGSGQVAAVARAAQGHRDVRVAGGLTAAAVAASTGPGTGITERPGVGGRPVAK